MSTAIAAYHGVFGRACLYSMNRPMTTHAHREGHLCFHVAGASAANTIDGIARPIAPAQAVGLNPWELHDFLPGSAGESGIYLVLYIRPDWFETVGGRQAFGDFGRPEIDVNGYIRRRVERIADRLPPCRPPDLTSIRSDARLPAVGRSIGRRRRTDASRQTPRRKNEMLTRATRT